MNQVRTSQWNVWPCIGKRRRICGQASDGDGGAGDNIERKTKEEVVGDIRNGLSER